MKLPFWKKTLFTLILFFVAMLVMEVVLRACGLGPAPAPEPIDPYSDKRPAWLDPFEYYTITDMQLGFRNRPDGQYVCKTIEGLPLSTTDEYGYRNGVGWSGEDDSPIVLFVGDSTTFCSEVPDNKTITSEVAKLLTADGYRVRVLNAGVRGYGALQIRRMVEECLDRHPEIRVVVYTYCGNDPKESLVPGLYYPNVVPLLRKDEKTRRYETVDLIDTPFPEDKGIYDLYYTPPPPPWKTQFSDWLARRSVVWHFVDLGLERVGLAWRRITQQKPTPAEPPPAQAAVAKKKNSPDMMIYYPPIVREDAIRYGFPTVGGLVPMWQQKYWDEWSRTNHGKALMKQMLQEMDTLCQEHDALFLTTSYFYGEPARGTAQWYGEICHDASVHYQSLADAFDKTGQPSEAFVAKQIDGRYDSHYNENGTKTYAKAITPAIEAALDKQGIKPEAP